MKKKADCERVAISSDSFLKQIDEVIKEATLFIQSSKTDPLGHILEGLDMAKKRKIVTSKSKIIK